MCGAKQTPSQEEFFLRYITDIFRIFDRHDLFIDSDHISFSEAETLRIIREVPSCTMTDLVENLHLPPSTATSIVDRLVTKSLVNRENHPEDRRKIVLNITKEGINFHDLRRATALEVAQEILSNLTQEDLNTLQTLLGKIFEKKADNKKLK
jgi:DNA-binding MarR family transcriptional regulator